MIHDPSSYSPPLILNEIALSENEKSILRNLAEELSRIAALPAQKEKARLWQKLNDLDSERPMVWINELPWNELNVNDELTLRCEHEWAKQHEYDLRKTIYQWNHLPADMVVNDYLSCPMAIHSTDFGIIEDVDVAKTDESNPIVSRHYNIQIRDLGDLEKIKMPVVTHSRQTTDVVYETMSELYRDIMPVKKTGQSHIWFTPWDFLIRWWGVQEAMIDLVMRPNMVHDAVDRMVDAWMTELDQFVDQNLLSLDCSNTRVGSGGYGYASELPGLRFEQSYVKPENMWGCSNAQIFSEVSPEMHWEFAVEHDMRWLTRWGLTYYGCCEPLHNKMDIMRRIPNLRKISTSAWCDLKKILDEIGTDYVVSRKPSPAVFAEDVFSPQQAKAAIREVLDASHGEHHIEFIMKDVSTVKYRPERLWEWESICMELVGA